MSHVSSEIEPISLESLPSMPAAALTIVRLCDDPSVGLEELASAVTLDPVLSARILRMANSAAYSRGTDITSLDVAMMLMGTKVVKITALGFSLSSIVSDQMSAHSDIGNQVWRQCLVKAVACRELANLAGLRSAPEAFLAGLFDGMGPMLAFLSRTEAYGRLLTDNPWPDADDERACLGYSVTELVQSALRSWGVPDLYVTVLERADDPVDLEDRTEQARLASAVRLGRHATRLLLGGAVEEDTQTMLATRALGLDETAVDTIAGTLGVHVSDLAVSLDVDLGAEVDYQALLNQARNQLIETSLQMAEESIRKTEQIHTLEDEQESLRRDATTDRLTGLPNRACFDGVLDEAVRSRITVPGRAPSPGSIGLGMIDIDHFKTFNDTYGHRAGDEVLIAVGEALRAVTRRDEVIARYGGEEFVLVAHDIDSAETLAKIGERIRQAIQDLRVESDGVSLSVTVSIGAVVAKRITSLGCGGEIVEAADRLLYEAKRGGRNAVVVGEFTDITT